MTEQAHVRFWAIIGFAGLALALLVELLGGKSYWFDLLGVFCCGAVVGRWMYFEEKRGGIWVKQIPPRKV